MQAEVSPALLIRHGRKFHIRTYVVIVERPENDEVLDLYLYHQHEVRVAGVPVTDNDDATTGTSGTADEAQQQQQQQRRNRLAHITNGALSSSTERAIMSQDPELAHLQPSLDIFVAELFAKHLLPDISRRVTSSRSNNRPSPSSTTTTTTPVREFAVAGLDLMVTTQGRWYLLEVNVNPGAPSQSLSMDEAFATHLETFWKSLIDLVAGKSSDGFVDVFAILEQAGITES